MKVEKVMINGKGYYHYRHCEKIIANLCMRCCFLKEREGGGHRCALPFKCEPDGYYIRYNEKPIEIGDAKIYVDVPPPPEPGEAGKEQEEKAAAQQQLTERNEEKKPGIGKRSYYGFPNGVEAEDICRYLSFNLGNVVKYACRAGRKDAKKKIEDLQKARDYLDNEIKRLEEGEE